MIRQKPAPKKRTQAGPVVAGALKAFVERIESVESDQKASATDKREIYDEAKGHGYDAKTLRWIIQERKIEASDRAERDSLREVYGHALSLAVAAVSNGDMSLRQAEAAHGVSKSSIQRALAVPEVSREMVADDLGNLDLAQNEGQPPRSANPAAEVWLAIVAAREAHHAAIEAAREARRQQRQREREHTSSLASITADDMPEIPPFLRRVA